MNPLEQLSDIHIPDKVSLWPLAWGWWLAIIITVILIATISVGLYRFLTARRVKKLALQELDQLPREHPNLNAEVNQLLKRVALCYFPDVPIAALYGQQWSEFLTRQMPKSKQAKFRQDFDSLQQSLYQADTTTAPQSSIEAARSWIQSSVPPSKRQLQMASSMEATHV